MSVMFLLIPLSIAIAAAFLYAFVWAVRAGQFEDTTTPSMRLLLDEASGRKPISTGAPRSELLSPAVQDGRNDVASPNPSTVIPAETIAAANSGPTLRTQPSVSNP